MACNISFEFGNVLDQPRPIVDIFWLVMAVSMGLAVAILHALGRFLSAPPLK
jgi:hypothetical protein